MSNSQEDRSQRQPRREEQEVPPFPEEGAPIDVAGDRAWDDDLNVQEIMGSQRGTGRTYQPRKAAEEGLSYTPPRDPPTIPTEEDPQGSEVAAGFASSMEETDPDREILPDRIDRSDLEIRDDIGLALRYNSETAKLGDISSQVDRGVVTLSGTVPSDEDIALVYAIVSELEGVVRVNSQLEVAG